MYGFTTIANADAALIAADAARDTYAATMGTDAPAIAAALYPRGAGQKGRLPKAVQQAWDDAKAAAIAAGTPDTDDAPRKAVQRWGMTALIVAARPKGEDETDAQFHARILRHRALVMRGDADAIAAAIAGEDVTPKPRTPRPNPGPVAGEQGEGEQEGEQEDAAPVAPIDALADALKAYVGASAALLDALKACEDAGVRVPKARRTLAESNARMVLAAMTA